MADTQESANTSATPQAAPAAPAADVAPSTPVFAPSTPTSTPVAESQAKPVTADDIRAMVKNKDLAGLKKATSEPQRTRLPKEDSTSRFPAQQTQVTPSAEAKPAEVAQPAAQTTEQTVKTGTKFVVGMGDKKLELNDPDGFLGHKDADGLKKAAANNILYNKTLKQWADEALAREAEVKAQLRQAQEELARVKTNPPTPQTPTATPPQQPIASTPIPKVEFQKVPERPDLPEDISDWEIEHKAAFAKWQKESNAAIQANMEATAKVLAIMQQSGATVDASNPHVQRMSAQLAENQKAIDEFKALTGELKAQKQQLVNETANAKFWDEVDGFAQLHSEEFMAPAPLRELHKQIVDDGKNGMVWMDVIAMANGAQKPYGGNEQQWKDYLSNRAVITQKYIDGDKQVTENCTAAGVVPPNGFKEYFDASAKINTLMSEKARRVAAGELGQNATLQTVWHLTNEQNLNPMIRQMETQVRAEQTQKVVGALQQHQAQHAVNVPPELAQVGRPPMNMQRTVEELKERMRKNPRDPELRKLYAEATKEISAMVGRK